MAAAMHELLVTERGELGLLPSYFEFRGNGKPYTGMDQMKPLVTRTILFLITMCICMLSSLILNQPKG